MIKKLNIALVGNPNCGKTALFNALTGSKQKVANYAGVTVEKKHGYCTTPQGILCTLIDLPGTYALKSRSPDERVTQEIILTKTTANNTNHNRFEDSIDLILCVIDATNIANGLRLILELQQTEIPLIVAMNMMDVAQKKGYHYDLDKLAIALGQLKIIPTIASKKLGIDLLVQSIDQLNDIKSDKMSSWQEPTLHQIRASHQKVAEIIQTVTLKQGTPSKITKMIDNIVLNPFSGMIVLLSLLFIIFQAVFSWATIPQDFLQNQFDSLQNTILSTFPPSMISSLLANGIVAGIGAAMVFLPQILTIFFFIIILEDTGYMARAAFIMDKIMGGVGLHGRAFIPLLSSFACAIPGIMATRTIENRNDRLVTILISPLMTCSARIPVYTLLIGAFIPHRLILGLFNLQGLVMFILYASGIIFALIMAFVFKKFVFKNDSQPLIMELPSYKLPYYKNIIIELIKPAKSFILRAGSIILSVMVIIWFLCTFPAPPPHITIPAINYSIAGIIGQKLQPLFAPLGFSWQIVLALIPGMAAREVAVSVLGTIFALSAPTGDLASSLSAAIQHAWTIPTGLSLITWYIFAPQCLSTLAVAKRETNSWTWPIIMFVYQIGLAYLVSLIVYQLALRII